MPEQFQGVSRKEFELAVAINPYDARTGTPLRESASVTVEGVHETPRLNPTGYWVFVTPPVTLPFDTVKVTVEPTSSYVERTVEVDTTESPPAKRVEMYPSTVYTFPPGTTLVQGSVTDSGGDPVAGATVGIDGTELETRTDSDGEFVLEIAGIVTTESATGDDPLRVDPDSDSPKQVQFYPDTGAPETPTLFASHSDHSRTTEPVAITEGDRKLLESPIGI